MGFFDFIFGNKKEKERLERERLAEQERQRKAEEARIAKEREARLAENRRKEAERQARLKAEAERKQKEAIKPFVFTSNQHQRYENGMPVQGVQDCIRTVSLEINTKGCPGYQVVPGDGYIVKIFNDDLGRPQMADKPMRLYRKSQTSIELRGYPVEAQAPFGWQEIDLRDYSFIIYYENGNISKCVLHMLDRNTFIEYRQISTEEISLNGTNSQTCEAEQFALQARQAAQNGNTSLAHRTAIKALDSLVANPDQINKINDIQSFALALGKMMEGDNFSDNDTISKAVAISYYFLSRAIRECENKDPYLYVYRFSIAYEYNKAFYHLFAHSEGKHFNYSPFDVFGQTAMMTYEHHLQGMQMCDMFTEPRIGKLDNALNNIFHQHLAQYSKVDPEETKRIGNKYHDQLYSYLKGKIEGLDFDF